MVFRKLIWPASDVLPTTLHAFQRLLYEAKLQFTCHNFNSGT
jgi:hypothetical protein